MAAQLLYWKSVCILAWCWWDGHTIESIFTAISVTQLIPSLSGFLWGKKTNKVHSFFNITRRFWRVVVFCVPVVPTRRSLVQCCGDGHAVETVFMVVSLIELISYLPDVCGDDHKVSMGETNEYIPITIPTQCNKDGERTRFTANNSSVITKACCVCEQMQYQR